MPQKLYKILSILFLLGVVVLISAFYFTFKVPTDLEVDFLNVGQGDAILIKSPSGHNVLIDGGPDSFVVTELSKNLKWWDRTIDLMILTHPHDDHVTGLIDVIKRYKVKKILYTGVVHSAPNYLAWLEVVRDKKIPIIIIDREQKISLNDDIYLNVLYPKKSFLNKGVESLNNTSIVTKLVFGKNKFLFMGDAEKEIEAELLQNGDDLEANVLKLGHHGSDTSSTEDFLKAVNSEFAVISAGIDNSFGHPHKRILNRLRRIGIKIFRTDQDGTIKFFSDGEDVSVDN